HQRLHFWRLKLQVGLGHRAKVAEPCAGLRIGRGSCQLPADHSVVAHLFGRKLGKSVEPKLGGLLLPPYPTLEAISILRPAADQELGSRETNGVAPGCTLALMSLGDEVFEVAFPTAVIIGKKHQAVRSRGAEPTREMNCAHVQDEARAK